MCGLTFLFTDLPTYLLTCVLSYFLICLLTDLLTYLLTSTSAKTIFQHLEFIHTENQGNVDKDTEDIDGEVRRHQR